MRFFNNLLCCLASLGLLLLSACSERHADVKSEVSSSPSAIQGRLNAFNQLWGVVRTSDPSTKQEVAMFGTAYKREFSVLQNRTMLQSLTSADVAELFNVAYDTEFLTDDPMYLRDMQLDLGALEHRNRASSGEYLEMYDAFMGARMFSQAREIRDTHPSYAMPPVPRFDDRSGEGNNGPTVLDVSSDGNVITRLDYKVSVPALVVIVVSPECHFSQFGLHDIEADSRIGPVFAKHALWLVPPDNASTPIASVVTWNKLHPRERMKLAYRYAEWPMIDRWELPTFYFFKNGKLVSQVIGWPRGGRKPAVMAALTRIGLGPVAR